ncbi:acetylhydrolase [soil metagenome]
MRVIILFSILAIMAGFPRLSPAVAGEEAGVSSAAPIRTITGEWADPERKRTIPFKAYIPSSGAGPFPVVIVSHGLGGTRDGISYLGKAFAAHGFISVHIQHPGSDDTLWRGNAHPFEAMRGATTNLEVIMNRPKDVSFVLNEIARRKGAGEEPWLNADMDRVAVAGHSYGAYTALASAGRRLVGLGNAEVNLSDARIKACIALSPPAQQRETTNGSYSKFAVPCLHMTGTQDGISPVTGQPENRRIPFETIQGVDEYLLTLAGGDHGVFNGSALDNNAHDLAMVRRSASRNRAHDAKDEALIVDSSIKFLDAYLKQDAKAKSFLQDGGFAAELGVDGTWEIKRAAEKKAATPASAATPVAGMTLLPLRNRLNR